MYMGDMEEEWTRNSFNKILFGIHIVLKMG